ncbi:MAG: M14 family metallopeptidase, partial [Pyrinomonadaceae bacterium]|nr:M14 family metallopeptidase [Pyrinomonadaceae bacterium]
SRNVPAEWLTTAESTNYQKTPRYAETIAYSKRLDASSRLIAYKSFGKSSEGRDLPLLIAASGGEFDPVLAKKSGKAVILVQAAIHSGESDGKDAGLALLRDIAVTGSRKGLLTNTIILFVPIYNVDGHELFSRFNRINQNGPDEMGFRANSANQNLNRDYLKVDTEETRSWLALWNRWDPDFFIDCHVTDGADFRYNITFEFAHHGEIAPELRDWMREHFENQIVPSVEAEGNLLSRYIQMLNRFEPMRGIASFIATPRFATGYSPLRDRNGLLIEAHSVKPYKSRVRGTYDVLWKSIEHIGENKASLFAANLAAERRADSIKSETADDFVLAQRIGNKAREYLFKGWRTASEDSAISGAKKIIYTNEPKDYKVPQYDTAVPVKTVKPPHFYIVPPQWREVIKRLEYHGVPHLVLSDEASYITENMRLVEPKWRSRPFEGRLTLSVKSERFSKLTKYPKGSVVVPVKGSGGKVAMHWLEPEGPDSAVYWGFFNAIFEQKEYSESYVMEDIAAEMLNNDPELKKKFEEKLEDEKFASSPRARMRFFYENSPYFDKRIGVYPVGRVTSAETVNRIQKNLAKATG